MFTDGAACCSWGLCDAFAEVEVEGDRRTTEIRHDTLSPVWSADFILQSGRPADPGAVAVVRLADHSLTGSSPVGCVRLPLTFPAGAGTAAAGPDPQPVEPEPAWHAIVDETTGAPVVGLAGTCSGFDDDGKPVGMRRRQARLRAGAAVHVHLDVFGSLFCSSGNGSAEAGTGCEPLIAALAAQVVGASVLELEPPPSVLAAADLLATMAAKSTGARLAAAAAPGLPAAMVRMLRGRGFAQQRSAARLVDAMAAENGPGRLALYLEDGLVDALARVEARVRKGAAAGLLTGGLAECPAALRKLNASWAAVPMATRQRM
jgi:hypothetical protein